MTVDTARQAAELLAPHFATRGGRSVAVLHLDTARGLIDVSFAEAGPAGLPVRDILAAALRVGAEAVIVGLGRPAGDAMPTEDDRAAARRLAAPRGEMRSEQLGGLARRIDGHPPNLPSPPALGASEYVQYRACLIDFRRVRP